MLRDWRRVRRRGCSVWALVLGLAVLALPAWGGEDEVIVYPGYGDARGALVEGRVIERHGQREAGADDGKLRNLARNARLLKNDERKQRAVTVTVNGREWATQSDDEGYFRVALEAAAPLSPGWHRVEAVSGRATGHGELLIVPPGNRSGLISDIDDTILVSEVNDKSRLLANSLLKNPAQRQAVSGMAELYAQRSGANPQADAAPLFYLSASPRQLQRPLAEFLARNRFPRGVLITKRVTNNRSSEPLVDQFAYKTRKLEELFARLPDVRFVLVGDDGERDPEIYDWVRGKYPERVEAIWIRRVNPDPARPVLAGQRDLSEVLAQSAGVVTK